MSDQNEMEQKIPEQFFIKYPDSALKNKFERILNEINDLWGTQQGRNYLEKLVVVDDRKERAGFDLTVMDEILYLTDLHAKMYPHFRKPQLGEDVWVVADRAHD